jgi:hypothetical protein
MREALAPPSGNHERSLNGGKGGEQARNNELVPVPLPKRQMRANGKVKRRDSARAGAL